MNILTENERAALLRSLANAPDEILIDAVRQYKDWMKGIRSSFDDVRALIGMKADRVLSPPPPPPPKAASSSPEVATPKNRPNVNPGRSSITKIGQKTKDQLLHDLRHDIPIPAKYEEHLKLMHNRGEIKFDGTSYYL